MRYDDESIQEIKNVSEGKSSIHRASVKLRVAKRTIQRRVSGYRARSFCPLKRKSNSNHRSS